MAILKIAKMGHPVLAQKATPVANPADPAIRRLVSDMVETMIDANGAGLAAPQVHVPLRVVVFQAPGERSDPGLSEDERFDHTAPLTVLINPEIQVMGSEREAGWEGCLSVPGLRGWWNARRTSAIAATIWTVKWWSAPRAASTPASCSTNAIIWTAFSIRAAWATCRT
jgi:peptide deformylase